MFLHIHRVHAVETHAHPMMEMKETSSSKYHPSSGQ